MILYYFSVLCEVENFMCEKVGGCGIVGQVYIFFLLVYVFFILFYYKKYFYKVFFVLFEGIGQIYLIKLNWFEDL